MKMKNGPEHWTVQWRDIIEMAQPVLMVGGVAVATVVVVAGVVAVSTLLDRLLACSV